jgi:hypothetical protein
LGGDVVSVCRQPINLLFSLFARTNSPSGKQALTFFRAISEKSNRRKQKIKIICDWKDRTNILEKTRFVENNR